MRHTTPNLRAFTYSPEDARALAALDAEIRHAERMGDLFRAATLTDRKIQLDRVIKGEPLRPNATRPVSPRPRPTTHHNPVRRCMAKKGISQ